MMDFPKVSTVIIVEELSLMTCFIAEFPGVFLVIGFYMTVSFPKYLNLNNVWSTYGKQKKILSLQQCFLKSIGLTLFRCDSSYWTAV